MPFTATAPRRFQHTAARRRLGVKCASDICTGAVSTHSRPKAAGSCLCRWAVCHRRFQHTAARRRLVFSLLDIGHHFGFNTQPPEGGWMSKRMFMTSPLMFQHTAARRRLDGSSLYFYKFKKFQHTAARRRLADKGFAYNPGRMFQHTAARRRLGQRGQCRCFVGGFNTQPPEGGWGYLKFQVAFIEGFNTQPPEGGWRFYRRKCRNGWFQHTAARRRLAAAFNLVADKLKVSTHSRPKAAGKCRTYGRHAPTVSTHSRPKAAGAANN